MIISYSKQFIFIHIAKCGGMTITNQLSETLNTGDLIISGPNPIIVNKPRLNSLLKKVGRSNLLKYFFYKHYLFSLEKHSSALKILKAIGEKRWKEYYKFSVVRNPFDRCVSAFFWIKKNKGFGLKDKEFQKNVLKACQFSEFSDFIKSHEFIEITKQNFLAPASNQISDMNMNFIIDDIAKLENLYNDLEKNKLFSNTKLLKSRYDNSSKRSKNYRIYYDKLAKDIVAETYKNDLDLFDYKF